MQDTILVKTVSESAFPGQGGKQAVGPLGPSLGSLLPFPTEGEPVIRIAWGPFVFILKPTGAMLCANSQHILAERRSYPRPYGFWPKDAVTPALTVFASPASTKAFQ